MCLLLLLICLCVRASTRLTCTLTGSQESDVCTAFFAIRICAHRAACVEVPASRHCELTCSRHSTTDSKLWEREDFFITLLKLKKILHACFTGFTPDSRTHWMQLPQCLQCLGCFVLACLVRESNLIDGIGNYTRQVHFIISWCKYKPPGTGGRVWLYQLITFTITMVYQCANPSCCHSIMFNRNTLRERQKTHTCPEGAKGSASVAPERSSRSHYYKMIDLVLD